MQTKAIVYGRAAYEGFAKAIGSRLGLNVKIDDGATACINSSGTITMPGMSTYQSAHEFAATCGTIVHELAHQFYGSHQLIDPHRGRLEHDCLNAVLDVADESWIAAYFTRTGNTRPGQLLATSNDRARRSNESAYVDWRDQNTHAWKVLCVGILSARGVRRMSWLKRVTVQQASARGVDAAAAFALLRKAKITNKQNPSPTPKRFRKLLTLARKLADLLKPFAPPPGAPQRYGLSGSGDDNAVGEALGNGYSAVPSYCREATAAEGAAAAESVGGAGGGSGSVPSSSAEFDPQAYALLYPAAERVAQRIATDGDGIDRADGLTSGSSLGQAHRLLTDGMCLSRWETSDNADGVAVSVLLDCSASMRSVLVECAGIARAFAQAMRNAGPVQALVFGDDVEASDDFRHVRELGSTNTARAVRAATRWLEAQRGRKWMVIVTDGQPNDPTAAETAVSDAVAQGVRVLVVGLGVNLLVPHATCVSADDPTHLAVELDAAAHQIECGA